MGGYFGPMNMFCLFPSVILSYYTGLKPDFLQDAHINSRRIKKHLVSTQHLMKNRYFIDIFKKCLKLHTHSHNKKFQRPLFT